MRFGISVALVALSLSIAVAEPPADKTPKPGEVIENSIGMKLAYIPPGEFDMGSPWIEEHHGADEKLHHVKLTKGFYLGITEVTQGQWQAVMQTEPWKGKGTSDVKEGKTYAATYVIWEDAVEFCKQLSAEEKKSYRLPTEAEWEYACRAGSQTAYSFGNDVSRLSDYAWWGGIAGNGNAKTEQYAHEVGQKKANTFGLYDMHGNVWEWCSDWYDKTNSAGSGVDPLGPASGAERVLRGGAWDDQPRFARAAFRHRDSPANRTNNFGFRVVLISGTP